MYPELSSATDQNECESLLGALEGQPAGVREEWFKEHREGCTAAWCTPKQLAQIHAAQRGTGSTETTDGNQVGNKANNERKWEYEHILHARRTGVIRQPDRRLPPHKEGWEYLV